MDDKSSERRQPFDNEANKDSKTDAYWKGSSTTTPSPNKPSLKDRLLGALGIKKGTPTPQQPFNNDVNKDSKTPAYWGQTSPEDKK